jgi:hypothetical protein
MAQLLATYTAYTGKHVKRFASRAIAEHRVKMAMMAAQDATGHAGVPANTPTPLPPTTVAERVQAAADKGREPTLPQDDEPEAGVEVDFEVNPYPEGSLAAQLWDAARNAAPVQPRQRTAAPKAPRDPAASRRRLGNEVVYKPGGVSAPQAGSMRGKVFARIKALGRATIEQLDADLGFPTRSFLQKLAEKGHVEFTS